MNFAHFMRIEREETGRSRHYVVHTHDPRISIEIIPDATAPDRMGRGVIKRVCVPNSWAGNYAQYARFITAAQEFFLESQTPPVEKNETRRFAR